MASCRLLHRGWRHDLTTLVGSAERELTIVSPFVTASGIALLDASVSRSFRSTGMVRFLTNLSPVNICQNSTDPFALQSLLIAVHKVELAHLPTLHAKVYIADDERAIVTSGNLTSSGLGHNYEYGVELSDRGIVRRIRDDIREYGRLGTVISAAALEVYCKAAERVRRKYKQQLSTIRSAARRELDHAVRSAEDQLIRFQLAGGPITAVFANTVVYLLKRHGPLTTRDLHPLVQAIHPDLCDDTIDRVIDGQHFGKKWKHLVRIAQSHLKTDGLIELRNGVWRLMVTK
jgi:hypothetical protein